MFYHCLNIKLGMAFLEKTEVGNQNLEFRCRETSSFVLGSNPSNLQSNKKGKLKLKMGDVVISKETGGKRKVWHAECFKRLWLDA